MPASFAISYTNSAGQHVCSRVSFICPSDYTISIKVFGNGSALSNVRRAFPHVGHDKRLNICSSHKSRREAAPLCDGGFCTPVKCLRADDMLLLLLLTHLRVDGLPGYLNYNIFCRIFQRLLCLHLPESRHIHPLVVGLQPGGLGDPVVSIHQRVDLRLSIPAGDVVAADLGEIRDVLLGADGGLDLPLLLRPLVSAQ